MATNTENARFIVESVEILHRQGYGKLKLTSYVKDGIMAWRHWLFASDSFPTCWETYQKRRLGGSSISSPVAFGESATEVAEILLMKNPEFFETAKGSDPIYENWYREMLIANPVGVLEMEFPHTAKMNGKEIKTPYDLKEVTNPPGVL